MSKKTTLLGALKELKSLQYQYEDLCGTYELHKDNCVLCDGLKINMDKVKKQIIEYNEVLNTQIITVKRYI